MGKTNLSVLQIQNVTKQSYQEKMTSGSPYVTYGSDNKFPDFLWSLYTGCPTHQSVIDGKVDYILGSSMTNGDVIVNEDNETLSQVIKRVALDQQLFGGFAIQVVYNKAGSIYALHWADFSKLRISKNGKKIAYRESWSNQNGETVEFDAFDINLDNKTTQIYYSKSSTCRSVYPLPSYLAAVPSIQTEIEIQDYHLNNIMTGFAASTMINMNNGVPESEDREELEARIEKKFCGAKGAGKVLINWSDSKDSAATVTRIDTDGLDTKFEQLAKSTQRNIFVAHRVTSPMLFGVVPENTGFSKTEYQESFDVFNATIIRPLQKELEQALTSIYGNKFNIEPFKL